MRRFQNGLASFLLLVTAAVAVGGGAGYFLLRSLPITTAREGAAVLRGELAVPSVAQPSPTSFPFAELTIPHLRARSYESSLGELTEIAAGPNYKRYLTSYDSDGLRVNGLLTVPEGEGPHPAIVFVHGYIPPSQYRTTERYVDYVDFLAKSGFVVFKIDLRGHGDSEGEASGAYYSGDYVVDTLNAYSALGDASFVDSSRVGLWGHSMAGNVVTRALAAKPDIPRVVVWAGAVYSYEDFNDYSISDGSYRPPPQESERRRRREELFSTHGPFDPTSEFWKQVPMTNFLGDISGAVQVHHAVDDQVVEIGYSRNAARIFEEAGVDFEYYEYPTGGHNITGPSFTRAMERTAEFFRE